MSTTTTTTTHYICCFFPPLHTEPEHTPHSATTSARALHFIRPPHDLVILDGRTDRLWLQHVIHARQIPVKNVFLCSNYARVDETSSTTSTTSTTSSSSQPPLSFYEHLFQHDIPRLLAFLNHHLASHSPSSDRDYVCTTTSESHPGNAELVHVLGSVFPRLTHLCGDPVWRTLLSHPSMLVPLSMGGTSVWSRCVVNRDRCDTATTTPTDAPTHPRIPLSSLPHGMQPVPGQWCRSDADLVTTWNQWGRPTTLFAITHPDVLLGVYNPHSAHYLTHVTCSSDGRSLVHSLSKRPLRASVHRPLVIEQNVCALHDTVEFVSISYDTTQTDDDGREVITLGPVLRYETATIRPEKSPTCVPRSPLMSSSHALSNPTQPSPSDPPPLQHMDEYNTFHTVDPTSRSYVKRIQQDVFAAVAQMDGVTRGRFDLCIGQRHRCMNGGETPDIALPDIALPNIALPDIALYVLDITSEAFDDTATARAHRLWSSTQDVAPHFISCETTMPRAPTQALYTTLHDACPWASVTVSATTAKGYVMQWMVIGETEEVCRVRKMMLMGWVDDWVGGQELDRGLKRGSTGCSTQSRPLRETTIESTTVSRLSEAAVPDSLDREVSYRCAPVRGYGWMWEGWMKRYGSSK